MTLDVQTVLCELTRCRESRHERVDVALMTLVVFFEDGTVGDWLRDRIHALGAKHPSRVILLDATQSETMRHVGSVACDQHGDCVKTRGEWIELGVAGSDPETLRVAVEALALPQVPVVLVWASGRIGDDPRFVGISPHARTIVYNSSALGTNEDALRQLVAFERAHPDVFVNDIAYLRLAPWQESVALFFDGKGFVQELFDLRHVEIASGSAAEAYYLLGWLASRLEWVAHAPDRFRNRFGTEIAFTLAHEGPPRRIRRVALHSSQSHFVAELRAEDPGAIELTVSGAAKHPDRYYPIADLGTAALIERAILAGNKDRIFHDTLLAASEILSRKE